MRIDHIAMYVNDLEREKAFFEKYFDVTCGELYHNAKTGFYSYFLSFEDGARIEIMNRGDMTNPEKTAYRTGFHHISIQVGGKETVDRLTAQITGDGYGHVSGPRTTGDGYYESCVLDPEGNQIELQG